ANSMTSQRVEPRTAKNSGLRPSRSKSGWATARDESANRWSASRLMPAALIRAGRARSADGRASKPAHPEDRHRKPRLTREPGRGVGEVGDERQDRRAPLAPQSAIEALHDRGVGVERDGVVRVLGSDPREAAVVAAEVPDEPPPPAARSSTHEALLALRVRL